MLLDLANRLEAVRTRGHLDGRRHARQHRWREVGRRHARRKGAQVGIRAGHVTDAAASCVNGLFNGLVCLAI